MERHHVALLRGINVGGKNKLLMKDLASVFGDAGCQAVRTYIQSGNVVFEADSELVGSLDGEVSRLLEARFSLRVPIVIRSASELREAVDRNPFVAEAADPRHLHVGFLADRPAPGAVASLDPDRSSVDSFQVIGREVHLHVPGGMARTKLTTDYFDRRLDTVMTVRNWRTVNTLLAMIAGG